MNGHASLDWEKLLEYASEEARTEPGFERIDALFDPESWAKDPASAQLLQAETQEAIGLLDRESLWGPLTDLASPAKDLEALAKGSVLSPANSPTSAGGSSRSTPGSRPSAIRFPASSSGKP